MESLVKIIRDPLFPLLIESNEAAVLLRNEHVIKRFGPGRYRRLLHVQPGGVRRLVKFRRAEWTHRTPDFDLLLGDGTGSGLLYAVGVQVSLTMRTNPDPELLEQAVSRIDAQQIDEQLSLACDDRVKAHVAETFGGLTHNEFMALQDPSSQLNPGAVVLFDGLIKAERIISVVTRANEQVLKVHQTKLEAVVELVRAEGEQSVEDLRGVRQAARENNIKVANFQAAAALSQQLGISFEAALNPELIAAASQGQLELQTTLLNNPESLRALMKNPEVLQGIFGRPQAIPEQIREGPERIDALPELQLGHDPEILALLAEPDADLIDGSCLQIFSDRGHLTTEAVIVGQDEAGLQELVPMIQEGLMRHHGASTAVVHAVPYSPTLPTFVESFYTAVAPPQAFGYTNLRVLRHEATRGAVSIAVSIQGAQRSLDAILNGESNRRTQQLQKLLMAKTIRITGSA